MSRYVVFPASGSNWRLLATVFVVLICRQAPLFAQLPARRADAESESRALRVPDAARDGLPEGYEEDVTRTGFESASAKNNVTETNAADSSFSLAEPESAVSPALVKETEVKPPVVKSLTILTTERGNLTFTPGFRVQPRYDYNADRANNDFFIRRFRLKGSGDAFGIATYGSELRFDASEKFEPDLNQAFTVRTFLRNTTENAWIQFPCSTDLSFRVGLYDVPFSRNSLTSDSKLLFMDRSLIKEALTANGLADNTVGVMAHGRPWGGHFEYAVGVFDNIRYDQINRESDELMPAGRIVFNLLDPAPTKGNPYADYLESYLGKGQRLNIGMNAAYLGDVRQNRDEFDLYAWGADLFFNWGPFTFTAEYDWFTKAMRSATPDVTTDGWFVQVGYLIFPGRVSIWHPALELACQYEVLNPNTDVSGDTIRWTHVGMNVYFRDHNLKIQTDYVFKNEERRNRIKNDAFQIQMQLDF